MYTVKQVATLTGVAEATLRVWERRYAVVNPSRTPGGYRLYDDNQVEALREMASLVEAYSPDATASRTNADSTQISSTRSNERSQRCGNRSSSQNQQPML